MRKKQPFKRRKGSLLIQFILAITIGGVMFLVVASGIGLFAKGLSSGVNEARNNNDVMNGSQDFIRTFYTDANFSMKDELTWDSGASMTSEKNTFMSKGIKHEYLARWCGKDLTYVTIDGKKIFHKPDIEDEWMDKHHND